MNDEERKGLAYKWIQYVKFFLLIRKNR
jgi:hypothetical protein